MSYVWRWERVVGAWAARYRAAAMSGRASSPVPWSCLMLPHGRLDTLDGVEVPVLA